MTSESEQISKKVALIANPILMAGKIFFGRPLFSLQ